MSEKTEAMPSLIPQLLLQKCMLVCVNDRSHYNYKGTSNIQFVFLRYYWCLNLDILSNSRDDWNVTVKLQYIFFMWSAI